MASISFRAKNAELHKQPAIEHSDFEEGFSSESVDGNRTTFTGKWICPASPEPYTQAAIYVSPTTQNTCVVIAKFSFDGSFGTITGTMYINEGETEMKNAGIATAAIEATEAIGISTKGGGINGPYLMGGIHTEGF